MFVGMVRTLMTTEILITRAERKAYRDELVSKIDKLRNLHGIREKFNPRGINFYKLLEELNYLEELNAFSRDISEEDIDNFLEKTGLKPEWITPID